MSSESNPILVLCSAVCLKWCCVVYIANLLMLPRVCIECVLLYCEGCKRYVLIVASVAKVCVVSREGCKKYVLIVASVAKVCSVSREGCKKYVLIVASVAKVCSVVSC